VDQLSILRSLCKFSVCVSSMVDLAPTLRAAFQAARSGVPGPVFVEIPIDILYPYSTVKKELMGMEFKGLLGSITKAFINRHVKRTYSGALLSPDLPPLPVDIPLPPGSDVAAAACLVKHAKKPVLLIGSQATLEVKRIPELVAAAKSLGIPTYVSGMARGLLGHQEELWFRQNRANALRNADVIILCGTVCDFRLKYGGSLGRKAKVSSILHTYNDLLILIGRLSPSTEALKTYTRTPIYWEANGRLQCHASGTRYPFS
jgi:acetolactate synthase-like protein